MTSRLLLLYLLLPVLPVWADGPIAPKVSITGPLGVAGDGTRDAPFVFSCGAKGKLTVTTDAEVLAWVLDDAPVDTEVLPGDRLLWFPTDRPGVYVVFLSAAKVTSSDAGPTTTTTAGARCWIEIKGSDGPDPPITKKTIAERVTAALTGPDAKTDAIKFEAAITAVAEALEQNKIADTGQMESALQAALEANHWPVGRYPKLSKLMGELFGEDVPVKAFTTVTRTQVVGQLKELAAACQALRGP